MVESKLGGLALMMTKTMTGTKSSAAGTDLVDAMDRRFMMVCEHLATQETLSCGVL